MDKTHKSQQSEYDGNKDDRAYFREKQMYIDYEIMRHEAYIAVLKKIVHAASSAGQDGGAQADGLCKLSLPVLSIVCWSNMLPPESAMDCGHQLAAI